jgi:phage-related protein
VSFGQRKRILEQILPAYAVPGIILMMARKNRNGNRSALPPEREEIAPEAVPKPVEWVKAARDDLRDMPVEVRRALGGTLMAVQYGQTPQNVSSFEGSIGGNILKITDNFEGDTYRLVYAAKFARAIYVLHAFRKKSTSGIATPKKEIDTVRKRFIAARAAYKAKYEDES